MIYVKNVAMFNCKNNFKMKKKFNNIGKSLLKLTKSKLLPEIKNIETQNISNPLYIQKLQIHLFTKIYTFFIYEVLPKKFKIRFF